VPRYGYRIGVPWEGFWQEILNSDGRVYGGSGVGNLGGVQSEPIEQHGRASSIQITFPPLAVVVFRCKKPISEEDKS
jgi:1,4-alpha-glucan branching enzyme